MIYDLRYHIFTIGAIFAALGLGILIGSSFPGSDYLLDEQRKIINNIEDEVIAQKAKNRKLNEKYQALQDQFETRIKLETRFLEKTLPHFMLDKDYVLLTDRDSRTEIKKLENFITLAGADIKVINQWSGEGIETDRINSDLIWWPSANNDNESQLKEKLDMDEALKCNSRDPVELMMWLMEMEYEEKAISFRNNSSLQ